MLALAFLDSLVYVERVKKIRVSPNTWIPLAAYTQAMETMRADAGLTGEYILEATTGEVRRGSARIGMSGRERDLALAIATREHPVTTAELAEMLYPDRDLAEAANIIKVYVFRLRKRLGAGFILWRDGAYVVGHHVELDLAAAKVLLDRLSHPGATISGAERERAVWLARGLRHEALPRLADCEWFMAVAQCARRVGRELTLLLGRNALNEGKADEAMRLARELTFADPCDEEAWELLIQAHLTRGEHLAAVAGFRFYERILAQELDLAPSPYLRALLA